MNKSTNIIVEKFENVFEQWFKKQSKHSNIQNNQTQISIIMIARKSRDQKMKLGENNY